MGHEMWHSMACDIIYVFLFLNLNQNVDLFFLNRCRVFLPQRKLKQLNMVSTLTDYLALLWGS